MASTTICWSSTLSLETGLLPPTLARHLQVCETLYLLPFLLRSPFVYYNMSQEPCVVLCSSVGLYGHSAVYHEQTDAVYVFGGYRFHVETVQPSGELYSLYYPNLTWSLLVPSQGNKV